MTTDLRTSIATHIRHCCPGATLPESEAAADVILAAELNRDTLLRLLDDRTRRVEELVGERDGLRDAVAHVEMERDEAENRNVTAAFLVKAKDSALRDVALLLRVRITERTDAVTRADVSGATGSQVAVKLQEGDRVAIGAAAGIAEHALALTPQAARERAESSRRGRLRDGEVRYLTDDCDQAERTELAIFRGGNGDWYIGTMPEGEAGIRTFVRICTSGGAAARCPRLVRAIFDAYQALAALDKAPR